MEHRQLGRVLDGKGLLAAALGKTVKGELKGLFEQQGEPLGKGLVLGDNPGLLSVEGVAVEQYAVGLRLGAASAAQRGAAQLAFHFKSKGHGYSSKM